MSQPAASALKSSAKIDVVIVTSKQFASLTDDDRILLAELKKAAPCSSGRMGQRYF